MTTATFAAGTSTPSSCTWLATSNREAALLDKPSSTSARSRLPVCVRMVGTRKRRETA
jgi:hypothetical protein